MESKAKLQLLGFTPKEGASGVFLRQFNVSKASKYLISVDVPNQRIDYGSKIKFDHSTTQNFSQAENWVVLECVCRLLEKGYSPECITLEKTWSSGHGKSARLDICVSRTDGSDYLLIECKTWGTEYDKALVKLQKDGGQLFTYFKFSNHADVIMLYASEIARGGVQFKNDIISIQDDYRLGDVQDFYKVWNKLCIDNGVFETEVAPYQFRSKYLTPEDLKDINHADSSLIFNQFLEILRHNVVSDKPNAFNKIFTLFLCKVYDEKKTDKGQKLRFQWEEGVDDDVSFQLRLTDLYQEGMKEFLDKDVTDISEKEIRNKYRELKDSLREELLQDFKKLRLEKNNEFAIKEVFDRKSFEDNAKVVKEVVQLLQKFRIRYNKRQQYLSDFFEQLLTTGLKQEAGQFFTPVPVAQFIIKSLPVREITQQKLMAGKHEELLPYVMDYAAGSGHFLTEVMHELQRYIDSLTTKDFIRDTKKSLDAWQSNHFDWAEKYIYGVEKDYRLVKVGKVGCYLHGDGLANIVHSDGLGSFLKTPEYKERLKRINKSFPKENQQFDIVISNPPYSVEAFKGNARKYYDENDFTLYNDITDDSSAIECLFIERTQQLLKEGGVAGVILPRSILSNGGVYEKARTLLLKYFDIVAIAELGSNTFMATGTNTVTLFMRRRDSYLHQHIEAAVATFMQTHNEVTINGIEQPVTAYLSLVWRGLALADYQTLLQKSPNAAVREHELFQWLDKNIREDRKGKASRISDTEYWVRFLAIEQDKLTYFIRTYPQKVVVVKSGEKDVEKQFLGYYFSDRRGHEGIHPMRGAHVDECTKLFHSEEFEHPERASTYILQAFNGDHSQPIHSSLENHVHRLRLVEMIDFGRASFEKTINLAVKKKVGEIKKSLWPMVRLGEVCTVITDGDHQAPPKAMTGVPFVTISNIKNYQLDFSKTFFVPENYYENISANRKPQNGDVLYTVTGSYGIPVLVPDKSKFCFQRHIALIRTGTKLSHKFLYYLLLSPSLIEQGHEAATGVGQRTVSLGALRTFQIPLPSIEIQNKIVANVAAIEAKEDSAKSKIDAFEQSIENMLTESTEGLASVRLSQICTINPESKKPVDLFGKSIFNYIDISAIENQSINSKLIHQIETEKAPSRARKIAKIGDILLSTVRPNLKSFALVTELPSQSIVSTGFAVIRAHAEVNRVYLYRMLLTDAVVAQMIERMDKGAYPSINEKDVAMLQIPLPSLEIQNRLVAKITALEAKIATEKLTLTALIQERKATFERAVYEN